MDIKEVIFECQKQAWSKSLSLSDLAKEIGVSRSQISHWFHGRRTPSAANLWALIDAVGLKIEVTPATKTPKRKAKSSAGSARPKNQRKQTQKASKITKLKNAKPIIAKSHLTKTADSSPTPPKKEQKEDVHKPAKRAPAFENLSPEGLKLAREMFGLDLSDFNK